VRTVCALVRGKLRLMVASGQDSGVLAAERALMDELFSERGRTDPIAVLRLSTRCLRLGQLTW
jgi:hypothetical protein